MKNIITLIMYITAILSILSFIYFYITNQTYFSGGYFEAHSVHFTNYPQLMWFDIISNLVIGIAYLSIPTTLIYFTRKRKDIDFNWVFVLFSGFIFWCGMHHIIHVISFWIPIYAIKAIIDFITAIVSLITAIILWKTLPKALKLPKITEIVNYNKELEYKVKERTKKLVESEKQKDIFLGVASHELKTPITSIKAYTQVMHNFFEKNNDKKNAEYLEKMNYQIDKLIILINDLLDVTRIDSGKLQLRKEKFSFNNLVKETVKDIQFTTNRHKIICKLSKDVKIFADKDRIGQVIINLLTNAVKYSPKSSEIIVTTKITNNSIIFKVKDYGVGISNKIKNKIFDKFYQYEGKDTYPGLGIGLFISSEIINRHKGKIWFKSNKGKGTIFYFLLPLNIK